MDGASDFLERAHRADRAERGSSVSNCCDERSKSRHSLPPPFRLVLIHTALCPLHAAAAAAAAACERIVVLLFGREHKKIERRGEKSEKMRDTWDEVREGDNSNNARVSQLEGTHHNQQPHAKKKEKKKKNEHGTADLVW